MNTNSETSLRQIIELLLKKKKEREIYSVKSTFG